MAKKTKPETAEPKFTKDEVIQSKKFDEIEKDFLRACLTDDEYTIQEALDKLNKARKQGVK